MLIFSPCFHVHVALGWSRESLHDWWAFVKLAIPGLLMICMEFWGLEIIVLVSGKRFIQTITYLVYDIDFKSERGKGIASINWEEGERKTEKNRKKLLEGSKICYEKSGTQCSLLFLIRLCSSKISCLKINTFEVVRVSVSNLTM